ncbi:hypothetical protein [Hyalangium minutum]|nr:hypothetical protein [Hyalangium minutum]
MPPPGHRVRQFFHGMAIPLHLLRALWADPVARRQYLRVGVTQALAVLLLSIPLLPSRKKDHEPTERRRYSLSFGDAGEDDAEQEPERQRFHQEMERKAAELKAKVREASGGVQATTGERARAVAEAVKELAEVAKAEARERQALVEATKREQEQEQERGPIDRLLGRIDQEVQFWVTVFGIMQLVQWVVIALSRDYHDSISREASLRTALEPEDGPLTPRVRLDVPWMRKKVSRRIRAFVVFIVGMPVLYGLTAAFPIRHELMAVLVPAWSAYWLVVFTTARSAYAWKDAAPRAPWFLRGWRWLTTRVPGFRWGFLQRYGDFWTRRTREVFSPAAETEKQPWAFAGLTVVGMLSMLPLAKCFLRPLIPVAAGHLLVARQQAESTTAPKHLEPSAQAPTASSTAA